jgi:hypothetical protein
MSPIFVATVTAARKPAKLLCQWLALTLLRVVQVPRVVMLKRVQTTRLAASLARRLTVRAASLRAPSQAVPQTQPLRVVLAQRVRVRAVVHQGLQVDLVAGLPTPLLAPLLVILELNTNHVSAGGPSLTDMSTAAVNAYVNRYE